jgi:2-hydroxyglutarate dehydrogenase
VAVVGAGIVGLALARELIVRHPRLSVCVLEREREVAAHQSSHNSGVIHAGIYYAPGSLKARLCVEGARELYRYCEERGVEHRRCGKLIVARHAGELAGLRELHRRGQANGVRGLRLLEGGEIAALEPHARGVAALHSPGTGVVDFAAVARALAWEVSESGGEVVGGCEVRGVSAAAGAVHLHHREGVVRAGHALFCAGAWSDRLARAAGAGRDPRVVPFRGSYLRVSEERAHLVRTLIYPVPDPRVPFLGVHLTRTLGGEVLLGPTAMPALARDGYRAGTVRARDALEVLGWPGTWRMMRHWWGTGARELGHSISRGALVRAAAQYVPELRTGDVRAAFSGVRAQALARDGRLLDDFAFSQTERALHVRNAPSPGATAALAIARELAERAERLFDLSRAPRSRSSS